jgi:hypothetical protein
MYIIFEETANLDYEFSRKNDCESFKIRIPLSLAVVYLTLLSVAPIT